jgi:cytochrome c biogenesis protein CcdA
LLNLSVSSAEIFKNIIQYFSIMKTGGILFFASLIVGLYFLNLGFNFITIPETFSSMNKWMNVIGGILLIIGGFFAMRVTSRKAR